MRVYIAGKITGDRHYRHRFMRAEKALRRKGHSVMNPAWIVPSPEFDWEDYMRVARSMQESCEATLFLPGWDDSRGATEEHGNAMRLGQRIFMDVSEITDSDAPYRR